jgi:hypothetical protein
MYGFVYPIVVFLRQFLLVRLDIGGEHTDWPEGHTVRDEYIEVEHNSL